MAEPMRDLRTQQGDAMNVAGLTSRSGIGAMDSKVTRLVGQMCGYGGRIGTQQLDARAATHTIPQMRVAGPNVPAETDPMDTPVFEPESLELEELESQDKDLATAIEAGENKISGWDRFVARIKSWLPGRDLPTEVAKLAFSKIDQACQLVIFKLAFRVSVSSGSATNMRNLLEFCKTANINENIILDASLDAINSMPTEDQVKALAALWQFKSSLNWGNANADIAQKLILALIKASQTATIPKPSPLEPRILPKCDFIKAGNECRQFLYWFIYDSNPSINFRIENNEATSFVIDLLKLGKEGSDCLQSLIRKGILGSIHLNFREFEKFISTLNEVEHGAACLWSLNKNLVFVDSDTDTANRIVTCLAKDEERGKRCLFPLLAIDEFANCINLDTDAANETAINMVESGGYGSAHCLRLFLDRGKLDKLNLNANMVQKILTILAKSGGSDSDHCLQLLIQKGKLNNLTFDANFIINLARSGHGENYLRLLLADHNVKLLSGVDTAVFAQNLINLGENGVSCLHLLCKYGYVNPTILNLENPGVAKKLVIDLFNAGQAGAAFFWYLHKTVQPDLCTMNLKDPAIARAIVSMLIRNRYEDEVVDFLEQFLQNSQLNNPIFEGDAANELILDLFDGEPKSAACLQLLVGDKSESGKFEHSKFKLNLVGNAGKSFIIDLVDRIETGEKNDVACLGLLLDASFFDASKSNNLPIFDIETANDLHSRILSSLERFRKQGAYREESCLDMFYFMIKNYYQ
ncbi:MAG: hypothetical protein LBC30_03095 [Puniceicoccales bacterium]|jgi:hypothetical protein|nr:hypothetical protein [Puniceicoccales bacterium]